MAARVYPSIPPAATGRARRRGLYRAVVKTSPNGADAHAFVRFAHGAPSRA
jgi:hypothetical protein